MIAESLQLKSTKQTALEIRGKILDIGLPVTSSVSIKNSIAVGFGDGTIRFFDPGLTDPRVFKVHSGVVLCMVSNGNYILTGGDDGKFLKISFDGEVEEIADYGSRWVDTVAVYKNDKVCSSGNKVYVWHEGQKKEKILDHPSTVGGLAFCSNGKYLAVSCYGGVTVWERLDRRWKSSRFIYKGSHGLVSFSPDSKYLITAMQENEIHAWRLRDKDNLKMSGYPAKVKSFDWVGNTPYLVTSGANQAICWTFDGKDGPKGRKPICVADGGKQYSTFIKSLPDEEAIFTGFRDGTVLLSEIDENKNANIIRNPTGAEVTTIALTSDRSHILIGDSKGSILWSTLWAGRE